MKRIPIPLRERKFDVLLIAFFAINLVFVTYLFDIEQVIISDPYHFSPPLWPPMWMIKIIHWYGGNFDHLLMARPSFWKATIWLDLLFFGPFYATAIYAYWKGKDWIRFGSIVYASVILTDQVIILFEEVSGVNASPDLKVVLMANMGWFLFPIIILYRMWRKPHPFTKEIPS